MVENVLEIWRVHDEINIFLLENIPDEGFAAVPLLKTGKPSTGRTVSRVFAHLHEVRVSHVGRDFCVVSRDLKLALPRIVKISWEPFAPRAGRLSNDYSAWSKRASGERTVAA